MTISIHIGEDSDNNLHNSRSRRWQPCDIYVQNIFEDANILNTKATQFGHHKNTDLLLLLFVSD